MDWGVRRIQLLDPGGLYAGRVIITRELQINALFPYTLRDGDESDVELPGAAEDSTHRFVHQFGGNPIADSRVPKSAQRTKHLRTPLYLALAFRKIVPAGSGAERRRDSVHEHASAAAVWPMWVNKKPNFYRPARRISRYRPKPLSLELVS